MKIVLLPGVRIYSPKPKHEAFLKAITTKLGCEGEIFTWEPGYKHPEYNLPLKSLRDFTYEVILDFQEALTCAMKIQVPKGDVYIGHSAGSIIALVQEKPTVIMASPAALVNNLNIDITRNQGAETQRVIARLNLVFGNPFVSILNIINKYDVLACPLCPLDNGIVENYEYTGLWYRLNTYNSLAAHSDYWTNTKVINKIIETIQKWTQKC